MSGTGEPNGTGGVGAPPQGKGGIRERMTPARAIVLVLGVLGLIFIFENTHSVRIRLLIPEVTMPLWGALLITFVIGGLCGMYAQFARRRRRQRR